jgi:hypothetical protein
MTKKEGTWALLWRKQIDSPEDKEKLVIQGIGGSYDGPINIKVGDEFDDNDREYHFKVAALLSDNAGEFLTAIDNLAQVMGDVTLDYDVWQEIVDKTNELAFKAES